MKRNRGNQKSVYTKRQIAGALLMLLAEKEYTGLTVSELCERAGCSRPSFYRNFDSIDAVFAFLVHDKIDVYMENRGAAAGERTISGDIFDINILNLWGRDREFVSLIVHRGLLNDFIMIICRYLNEILRKQIPADLTSEKEISVRSGLMEPHGDEKVRVAQYRSSMQAYYTGAVLYTWADRGLVDEPEEILRVLSDIRNGESGFSKRSKTAW